MVKIKEIRVRAEPPFLYLKPVLDIYWNRHRPIIIWVDTCFYLNLSPEFGINLANCNFGNEPQAPASLLNPMPATETLGARACPSQYNSMPKLQFKMRLVTRCLETIEPCRNLWAGAVSRNWEQSSLLIKDGNVGNSHKAPSVAFLFVQDLPQLPDIVKETRDCCIFEAIATLPTFLECDAVTAVIGTREMKINGNVGIGTTAPGVALHVVGEVNITGISGDGTGKAVCIKSDRTLGTCSDAVGGSGTCTCG